MTLSLDQRIEIDANIVGGKPRIVGHRITVQNIAVRHEMLGHSAEEIATDYDLTLADIYVALAYYYANQAMIDHAIREEEAFIKKMQAENPSKLKMKLRERGN
jgi:uncharacterized protein (DUF433 family)